MAFFKGKRSTGRDNSGKKGGKRRTLGNAHKRGRASVKHSGGGKAGFQTKMHSARCSGCGNTCEVPFRPTGAKPVFCSACFRGADGDVQSSYNRSTHEENKAHMKQLDEINQKLDEILEILAGDMPEENEEGVAIEPAPRKGALKKAILKKAVKKKKAEKKVAAKKKKTVA